MRFCYGVMSKNIVDVAINNHDIILIPTRRQVDWNGGYANQWTTAEFAQYVKSKNPQVLLERDHAGPNQGNFDDDGYESLAEDCKYFDIIHIDPWKKYADLEQGINETVKMIEFCYRINPVIEYEIATEEAIRPFSSEDINQIIESVKHRLPPAIYEKIRFVVIQCGTRLTSGKNIGEFNAEQLKEMLYVVEKKHGLIAKEHNGDWISFDIIKEKERIGLKYINIAPELADIETSFILSELTESQKDELYRLCLESGKWKKWTQSVDTLSKESLIRICCHYLYSDKSFIDIIGINVKTELLRTHIQKRFDELNSIVYWEERKKCIICESNNFSTLFERDSMATLSLALRTQKGVPGNFMPFNVLICNCCGTAQLKYLGDLSIIYGQNHVDDFGITKEEKHSNFCDFILSEFCEPRKIIEVGSCNGVLAQRIISMCPGTQYTIIEPSYTGNKENVRIIPEYLENVDLNTIDGNVLFLSDVFEHFYEPMRILEKIQNSENIDTIYLNHPDFDYAVQNGVEIFLNVEHTFLIEHQFLLKMFERYGFYLTRRLDYRNFSLFLEFKRDKTTEIPTIPFEYQNIVEPLRAHYSKMITKVAKMNSIMRENPNRKYYVWPVSTHSINLFYYGLDFKLLSGVMDNSPNKIGKYLYGYNLECLSFNESLKTVDNGVTTFIAGAGNYIKELDISNTQMEILYVNEV